MKPWKIKFFVSTLLLLSGLCGLMYEVAWSKYLALFIGNTTYSQAIVLATYMAGLALGALILGKFSDTVKAPLRLYGFLEIAIGLYCFCYPHIIGRAEALFIRILTTDDGSSSQMLLMSLKFALSFTTLIFPTFLMGGTIPILTKYLSRNISQVGKEVAQLYFVNSVGAVIGAGLTGFLLIRWIALDGTVWIAATLNCTIGLCAWLIAKLSVSSLPTQVAFSEATVSPLARFSKREVRIAIVTAAITGFIAMSYQLIWTRLLSNILGSTTYSFTLMLIAFIGGISMGSWIVSIVINRVKNLPALLGICQYCVALFMLLTLPLYERLPYFLLKLSEFLFSHPNNFPLFLSAQLFFCFCIMIVPTTFSGMVLPLASRIASNDMKFLGKSIGGVFFVNTIGSVVGALVTSLIIIPLLGIKSSLELGLLFNGILGLILIVFYSGFRPRGRVGFTIIFGVMLISYVIIFPNWNENTLISGVFRTLNINQASTYQEFKNHQNEGQKILWYKEGLNANVAIRESLFGDSLQKSLVINGKADASTIGDLQTQVLLAHLPLLLYPDSGDALAIGLGSGITCGSALCHPLKTLDVVEIASEVVECNAFFAKENQNFISDPRVKIHIEDAQTYLKTTSKRYNYILSEPSNPWISGIGNLYSLEFFKLCQSRLHPGGVVAQWFHTYDISDDVFQLVLCTINQVFPTVTIWKASDADIVILASENSNLINFEAMDQKMIHPRIASDLARINIFDVPSLLSTQVMSSRNNAFRNIKSQLNTNQRPLLEFLAPISLFTHSFVRIVDSLDERISIQDKNLWLSDYEKQRPLSFQNYLNISLYRKAEHIGDLPFTYTALKKCLQLKPNHAEALSLLARVERDLGFKKISLQKEEREWLRLYVESNPDDISAIYNYVSMLIGHYQNVTSIVNLEQMDDAVYWIRRVMALTGGREEQLHVILATIYNGAGRFTQAAETYLALFQLKKKGVTSTSFLSEEELMYKIGDSYYNAGNLSEAEKYGQRSRSLQPGNIDAIALQNKIALKRLGIR